MPRATRWPPSPAPMELKSLPIPTALRLRLRQKEPSFMSPDRLTYMANQIGKFFQSQGHDKAVPGIADHIRKFWDPRMRLTILRHLDAGGTGLDPNVRDAI